MMTVRRFAELAESYGADFARWPEEARADAARLAARSGEAQRLLAEAASFDRMMEEAGAAEDQVLWQGTEAEAAVARLRDRVGAAIAAPGAVKRSGRVVRTSPGFAVAGFGGLEWLGMATGGGFAVAGGLLLAYLTASPGTAETVMSLLQPSPLHLFAL